MTIMNTVATKHSQNTIKCSHKKQKNALKTHNDLSSLHGAYGKTLAKVAGLMKNKPAIKVLNNYALGGHGWRVV